MNHIAFCCDDRYAPYLGAAALSILDNARDPLALTFWILGEGISEQARRRLADLFDGKGASYEFLDFDSSSIPASAPTHGHISMAAYIRVMLPVLLPQSVRKVLYLDCDLIANGPVERFFEVSLENRPCAAVINPGFDRAESLGLRKGAPYFNSGVLLINLEEWREMDLVSRAVELLNERHEDLLFHDQDLLNMILVDRWVVLHPGFNYQTSMVDRLKPLDEFKAQDLEGARNEPLIVHFSSSLKPWTVDGWHPWQAVYLDYLRRAGGAGPGAGGVSFLSLVRRLRAVWRYSGARVKVVLAMRGARRLLGLRSGS